MWVLMAIVIYFGAHSGVVYDSDFLNLGTYNTKQECMKFGETWKAEQEHAVATQKIKDYGEKIKLQCDSSASIDVNDYQKRYSKPWD